MGAVCLLNKVSPSINSIQQKDKWSKKYGVDRGEFESKIKEAGKLEAFIELARLAASEVEWLLPTGTVKPDNLNPSTLEKIGDTFKMAA